jgi:hypothetical protein
MQTPQLYGQLIDQLRQWIVPKAQRHLQGVAEAVAAILQSGSACLNQWIPFLSHRDCTARSHLERLSYLTHTASINAKTFYVPLLKQFLQAFMGTDLTLTLDPSLLGDQFCLIEVCRVWGGRSITLAQVVLEHGSATVAFEGYAPLLEQARLLLPATSRVTLLADSFASRSVRGFEHGELMRWCERHNWSWFIRVKVTVLGDIPAPLATANLPTASEPWAVLSNQPPSLHTFERYGQRFGGIEPHFRDDKSAAFGIIKSRLRDATALTTLFLLLDIATLIVGMMLVCSGQRHWLDAHLERGLSFLQLGLRQLQRLRDQGQPLPLLEPFPRSRPAAAIASQSKRERLKVRIEFSRVTLFSY